MFKTHVKRLCYKRKTNGGVFLSSVYKPFRLSVVAVNQLEVISKVYTDLEKENHRKQYLDDSKVKVSTRQVVEYLVAQEYKRLKEEGFNV